VRKTILQIDIMLFSFSNQSGFFPLLKLTKLGRSKFLFRVSHQILYIYANLQTLWKQTNNEVIEIYYYTVQVQLFTNCKEFQRLINSYSFTYLDCSKIKDLSA
jgi:hypothetical protein